MSRDVVHEVLSERYSMLSTRVQMLFGTKPKELKHASGVLIVGHLGERRAWRIGKNAKPCFVKTDWIVVIHSRLRYFPTPCEMSKERGARRPSCSHFRIELYKTQTPEPPKSSAKCHSVFVL